MLEVADTFADALAEVAPGRIPEPGSLAVEAAALVREVSRRAVSALATGSGQSSDPEQRQQAASAMKEIFEIAERMARLDEHDVVWLSAHDRFGRRR